MWMIRRIALTAALVGLVPVMLAGLAFALSWVFACPITEGGMRPCMAFGADISGMIGGSLIVGITGAIFLSTPAAAVVTGWARAELIAFLRNTP